MTDDQKVVTEISENVSKRERLEEMTGHQNQRGDKGY
uniref:Uncharacterized protein n=1 Tax=Marseillevirus LCMAC201 TaxID=2506605 RepID=A0A481YWJ5_9VIRU|nr:MAG: hypothetical protein LCMAC201_05560 [Marseillevirus LCMAC201]